MLFHLHCIKDNWPLSSNYFLHSMKLMKHEKSIKEQYTWSNHESSPFPNRQTLCRHFSYSIFFFFLLFLLLSQTLLWRAPNPGPLSVYFFLHHLFARSSSHCSLLDHPKLSSEHALSQNNLSSFCGYRGGFQCLPPVREFGSHLIK